MQFIIYFLNVAFIMEEFHIVWVMDDLGSSWILNFASGGVVAVIRGWGWGYGNAFDSKIEKIGKSKKPWILMFGMLGKVRWPKYIQIHLTIFIDWHSITY